MLIDPIKTKNELIQKQFNTIKRKIKIPAVLKTHSLKDNVLYVNMSIDIDQFRQWLNSNFFEGLINIRDLWYLFLDYINDIFNYGYFFKNIKQINRFLPVNKEHLSRLDNVIANLPYNICAAAEIYEPKIADDKNSFTFYIITEAYNLNEEIDNDIFNLPIETNIDDEEDNEDEKEDDEEEVIVETKEEEMQRLLNKYKEDGCNHAHIAYELVKEQQNNLSDLALVKQMELVPRIIKHKQNDKIISLLWSISKSQFSYTFALFRNSDVNQVWEEFRNDFINNSNQYKCINKKNMGDYLTSINQNFNCFIKDIYDVDISKENSIKFWTQIQVD